MQTATTSELPTRQKEGEGWGRRRRRRRRRSESESEGDNDRVTEERGSKREREGFGEVGGEKTRRGSRCVRGGESTYF